MHDCWPARADHRTPLQAYTSTFQPLLLEEAAAQLLRGQDEGSVALSQRCVVAACEDKGEGRVLLVLTLPPGVNSSFSENDVVLVSRDDPQVHGVAGGCSGEGCSRDRGLQAMSWGSPSSSQTRPDGAPPTGTEPCCAIIRGAR